MSTISPNDPSNQLMLVPHSYQGSLIQQRASDGYINATAMCKAAAKSWGHYRENATTKAFLLALSGSIGIPMDQIVQTIATGPNDARGTWIHPQVAIHLAQWLSAEFAVKVSEWVYDWMLGKPPTDRVWQQYEDRISLINNTVPLNYFCVFNELSELMASLITNGANPGTRMILDISVGRHWGTHWKDANLQAKFGPRAKFPHNYPSYFPQSWSNPQEANCYPEEALPTFRRWLREVYVPHKMPTYLKGQVDQKKLPAAIANNALAALAAREAARALPKPE